MQAGPDPNLERLRTPNLERLRTDFALHPITTDETATCRAMLEQDKTAAILLMPTHHISQQGDMMGFRYECSSSSTGESLPVVRNMFFGHTAVECLSSEADILALMSDKERNKARMAEFLENLRQNYKAADLSCIPDNAASITSSGVVQAMDLRSMDCKEWLPEVPESIGFYHSYIRGYNRDTRSHRLFIVCSGGCAKASDQFCNLIIDVGREWTAGEIADSEETWWLKRASQRARCRLIKMLADWFQIKLGYVEDVLAYSKEASSPSILLAVPTVETLEHDVVRRDAQTVVVHNLAVDSTRITNGTLCQMHPSEGLWLFKGGSRGSSAFGAMFGHHRVCGSFPTRAPAVHPRHPNAITVHSSKDIVGGGERGHYMCFDEALFKTLERMQWNRDNGFVELIPVVVGMQ